MSKKLMHVETILEHQYTYDDLQYDKNIIKWKQEEDVQRKKLIEKLSNTYDIIDVETNLTTYTDMRPYHYISYTFKCYNIGYK